MAFVKSNTFAALKRGGGAKIRREAIFGGNTVEGRPYLEEIP